MHYTWFRAVCSVEPRPHEMNLIRALERAGRAILTVAATYAVFAAAGMVMVHTGSEFAIAQRDRVVSQAQTSPITAAFGRNDRLQAAALDFSSNLFAAAADTVGGIAVVVPYPVMAYRGWVGGIVSIDRAHASRLADPAEAAYYLSVLILQIVP